MNNKTEALLPWYVAYTKPRQEHIALENLEQQQFNAYLPLFKKLKKPAKNAPSQELIVTHEPMFPRYIFFQQRKAEQSIAKVNYTRGISNIIRFGGELALVPDRVIDAIKIIEHQREQADLDTLNPLKSGARVRLNELSGLQGLEGIVQTSSTKRVTVLLEILGNLREFNVKPSSLDII